MCSRSEYTVTPLETLMRAGRGNASAAIQILPALLLTDFEFSRPLPALTSQWILIHITPDSRSPDGGGKVRRDTVHLSFFYLRVLQIKRSIQQREEMEMKIPPPPSGWPARNQPPGTPSCAFE